MTREEQMQKALSEVQANMRAMTRHVDQLSALIEDNTSFVMQLSFDVDEDVPMGIAFDGEDEDG